MDFLGLSKTGEDFSQIIDQMQGLNLIIILVGIGAVQFLSMMAYISATAVSRDGLNATFMKYIPISLYKQYIYKTVPNMILSTITILIVMGLIYYVTRNLLVLIPIFIISMLFNIFQSYLMEIVDLKKPKLDWDTEYAVVKQNMNLIWPMIFGMVNVGITALIGFISFKLNLPVIASILIIAIIYAVAIYITDRYIYKNQAKLFEKIY